MTLPTDMSFMDLLLDKEDNLLNFEKELINEDIKFNLDHKNINNDDWSNDVDFLDSLLEMEDVSQSYENHKNQNSSDFDDLVTPAESVVESSSCSDSGVSCDQQMSPMVQDMDDIEEVEEVVLEEEVYTEPVIKEEVVEIIDDDDDDNDDDDDSNLDGSTLDDAEMDSSDVKQVDNQRIVTLNVSRMQPVAKAAPPMVQVKPVAAPAPRRVIRVTPLQSNNPRSILIPVNGVAGVRTIKIINAGNKTASLNARAKQLLSNSAVITSVNDDKETLLETGDERETVYPRLQLTAEEKRLMVKEGITLPTHYPLTKHEERELKRIRRKIRNKISAQDSRKRKKEYVDGLEERVKQCTEENLSLLRRLKVLQTQNQSLCTQLRKLQAAVVRGSSQTTQPATCLMVLVLSLALVMAPNLRNSQSRPATDHDLDLPTAGNGPSPLAGRSRTLLFSKPADQTPVDQSMAGEEVESKKLMADLEELLQFNKPQQDDHDYTVGRKRTKTYIVPDIDDTWPPPKIPRQEAPTQPLIALHNKTRNVPEERKFIVELPE